MNAMTTSYIVSIESPDGSVATHEGVSLERVGQLLAVYSFGYIVSVKEIPAYRANRAPVAVKAPECIEMSYAGIADGSFRPEGF